MRIAGGSQQQGLMIGDLGGIVTEHAHSSGPDTMVLGRQELVQQSDIHTIETPADPEAFKLVTLYLRIGRGKRPKPALQAGEDFVGLTTTEFETRARTGAIFRQREVGEQHVDRGASDDRGLHERTRGIGNPIDTTMDMVAHRVTRAVLHVPDERIVPVGDVQGTIRRELHGDRPEITVGRLQEVLAEGQGETGAILAHGMLLGAEEADGVIDQDIALDVVREMAAADELETGGGAHHLGLGHEVLR